MEKQQNAALLPPLEHYSQSNHECAGVFAEFTSDTPLRAGELRITGISCSACHTTHPASNVTRARAGLPLKDEANDDEGLIIYFDHDIAVRDREPVRGVLQSLAQRIYRLGRELHAHIRPLYERRRMPLANEQLTDRSSFHAVSSLLSAGSEFAAASYGGRP